MRRATQYTELLHTRLRGPEGVAALLTFVHWIFAAFDFVPGLIHFLVIAALEIYRVWKRRRLKLPSAA